MKLTVERMFSDPPLSGTLPASLKFAPDGSYIAFLRLADDDRERMDLWRYDISTACATCWINANELAGAADRLSDAEKTERERKRQFATGITSFSFSADGAYLLVPSNGAGYLFEIGTGELHRFTPLGCRQTELRFSPRGRFVSYVRDNNLYRYEIATRAETAITHDGGDSISYGLAEFIAQEEMHRFDGYWWSPDEQYLAYTRVDESSIEVSQRFEFEADTCNVIEQRYPYAGGVNADVELFVQEIVSGKARRLDYRCAPDDYLARVNWAGSEVAVQSQSRDQKELTLRFFAPDSGRSRAGLTEHSETWIELHNNFRHLSADRFLWTSDRDGWSHLYLYANGKPCQLTGGNGRVNEILHVDDDRVLFSGWFDNPVEQHLYTTSLHPAGSERKPVALTSSAGWHEVAVATDGKRYIDRFTALDNPGEIRIGALADTRISTIMSNALTAAHPYSAYRDEHCTATLGRLPAEDGQWLHYRLTRPASDLMSGGGRPAIVYVYGGPGVQRVRNEWAPLLLQLLAHHGYGVLELDNRGSGNRERGFQAPIYRQLGAIEVADQLAGARFLQTLDWVNPHRIGVFGHSYGGYMAIMCLAKAAGTFKAGVAVAPVSDWRLYDTHYTERYLATPDTNSAGYEQSSVFPHLEGLRGKLLLIHGMADDNVLFTHSTKLYKALQSRNIPFEMMAYPGAKHALQERDVSIHRFNLLLDFFERQL